MTTASRPGKNAKDLSPKSPTQVKGGKIAINDNITILRSSKPKAKGKDFFHPSRRARSRAAPECQAMMEGSETDATTPR